MRFISLTLAVLLAACSPNVIGTPDSTTVDEPVTPTVVASTQAPTEEPTPEPTAEQTEVTLEAIAEAFRNSGVEIGEAREMTVEDYGLAPKADEGLRFLIPSLGGDAGGRIMRYDDAEVADRAQAFYEELGEQSAVLFSHVFRRENIVVQVNGTLPQGQADLLEAALDTLLPEE